ncbi:hypothetical protein FUAX_05440 [Fulvitalea axinellae]|uniref:Uncharacterized protein n=1 Tax=Fulvitalea axinellae TaxID=1182444 RepID=A0AAU9CJQ2_9BACT|nr:hypothetical protein FUAX_05440 [Fulvitalea axinellae]
MGLKEKRAIRDFQENKYNELKAELFTALGFTVDVEVDWDSLAKDEKVELYNSAIPDVYFAPQLEVYKDICQDDLGKEALMESLKTIRIRNANDIWSARDWCKFEDGVLTLDHETTTNSGNVEDRVYYLKELLESAL